jgi:hypothetical protein
MVAIMSALRQRRIEAVQRCLEKSPLAFFQDMRVERAQHFISTGAYSAQSERGFHTIVNAV